MGTPNWAALLAKDRCKAFGVSWTNKELYALHELKIPANYVRNGCFTLADYEKTKSGIEQMPKKPLRYMNKRELIKEATELNIECSLDVTNADLIILIEQAQKEQVQTNEQAKLSDKN